jgi:GT2 family glycosyltransferase
VRADLVTVYHNDRYRELSDKLFASVRSHEPAGGYRLISVDNRQHNRGFAKGCNLGAFHPAANAPIIGFLNPDLTIDGPFLDAVTATLDPNTVICGSRFGKSDRELNIWGVHDWVCGAAFFVLRSWFAQVEGFDTQFTWSWEETDIIRQAQRQGRRCQSIALPFQHTSPESDLSKEAAYKNFHFERGAARYHQKWGR